MQLRPTSNEARSAIACILRYIGEDPLRPGLMETPERMMRSWEELFAGYKTDIPSIFKTFDDGAECYDEMIVVKDIEFTSFCEHHWLPFSGVAHVGYIPSKKIVGLSKLGRLVDAFAKRLQVQERMTTQIVNELHKNLKPIGAGCVIEATHSCMGCRGVKKPKAITITSKLCGVFLEKPEVRAEFLNLAHS